MADATLQILGLGTKAVPLDYNVTGDQSLDLVAVKADFDGTAAGSSFVPVVEIISPAGQIMAQSKGPVITAGNSATVTFAPFLDEPVTASAGGGIQFDAFNVGDWLSIETLDTLANGQRYLNDGNGGIRIEDDGSGGITINATAATTAVRGKSVELDSQAGGTMLLAPSNNILDVQGPGAGTTIRNQSAGGLAIDAKVVDIQSDPGGISLQAKTSVDIDAGLSGTPDEVRIGGALSVFRILGNAGLAGPDILRVVYNSGTDTATYHIRTGAAWVADL